MEVDLEYPENLHDFQDYPMGPEKIKDEMLSPFCLKINMIIRRY